MIRIRSDSSKMAEYEAPDLPLMWHKFNNTWANYFFEKSRNQLTGFLHPRWIWNQLHKNIGRKIHSTYLQVTHPPRMTWLVRNHQLPTSPREEKGVDCMSNVLTFQGLPQGLVSILPESKHWQEWVASLGTVENKSNQCASESKYHRQKLGGGPVPHLTTASQRTQHCRQMPEGDPE